ncbi:MAG: hypothetical protein M1829_001811 [Trizodia sp. TS-e1964]|nr:MAG: hypothetical protein M1829_001811 [Trizodia sp. TS-e1964]
MALLAFYRRASVVKKHILILHCVEAFVTASYIAILLPVFFATSPVSCEYDFVAHFDDPVPCVSNVDTFRLIMAGSGFNILIDLIMVVLPWFVIPKLQLSRANKYKLIAMYSLGFFTIVASAVRIHGINIAGFDIIPKLEAQFTFNFTSMIEASTAIVCVNVPGIFAAFNRFRRSKNKGYTYGSGESGGDNTDGKVTISGGRTKRKTNTQDSEEKTDHNITLTHEFTVSDEESGNASNKEGSSNPV